MKRVTQTGLGIAALLVGTALAHQASASSLVNDFELNGSLLDSVGSATLTTGGTLTSTGVNFGLNQGPSVSGLAVSSVYTIDTVFSLTDDGPTARYRKLLDFSNLTSDTGLYTFYDQQVFYNTTPPSGTADFTDNTTARVTLSRNAAGTVTGYVDGVQKISYDDSASKYAVINSALNLFNDDSATGGAEASPGSVDYLRVYSAALSPRQISAAPEPATWALMIAGVGMVGATLRRRRALAVAAA